MAISKNANHLFSAANSRTDKVTLKGKFSLVISGTWAGTITLMKRYKDWNGADNLTLVHDGGDASAVFDSSTFTEFGLSELIGKWITNDTDDSLGPITANTAAGVVTATLAGGTDNDFDDDDVCSIWEEVASYTANQHLTDLEEVEDGVEYMAVFTTYTSGTACVLLRQ